MVNTEEASTEAPDEFSALYDITPKKRNLLSSPGNLELGARLIAENPSRFEKLLLWLDGQGVKRLREWERDCRQKLKEARKRGTAKLRNPESAPPPPDGTMVIDLSTPLDTAREFLATKQPTLLFQNGEWLHYRDGRYEEVEQLVLDHDISAFLESAVTRKVDPLGAVHYEQANPDPVLIDRIRRMVQVEVVRARGEFAPPCWLDPQDGDPPAQEILSCANGLLHLPTGRLIAPTPRFFTRNAVPFTFDPDAPPPTRWLKALEQWWPECPDSRECLAEVFGYLLLPDTSLQKIFILVGRSRGGKGTIIRVLLHLVGTRNSASTTLSQLSGQFGMQSLIGKQLAVMSDMYVHRAGQASMGVENLLRISGEDAVTVQRKHKTDWTGRLPTRFMMAATVAPILPDMSGALANRYVPLLMRQTFADNPDPYLFEAKLVPEMSGILNWAIEGWRRLKQRGHFQLTPDGADIVDQMRARSNPVEAFVRECCIVENGAQISKPDLFRAFERWTESIDGLAFALMNQAEFSRRLIVASGYAVGEARPRGGTDAERVRCFTSIRLRDDLSPDK